MEERIIEIKQNNNWQKVQMKDLKKDDVFRATDIYEDMSLFVGEYKAATDAQFNKEESIWEIQCHENEQNNTETQ